MLQLEWQRFDWDSRNVLIDKTKTKKKRVVPISPVVYARLKARWRAAKSPRVFAHANDVRRARTENKRTWFTCRRNAVVDACWHDLRHTCATWLVRANVPLPVIKRMLGMSIKILLEIYAHVSGDDLQSASRRIAGASRRKRKVKLRVVA
jgi:integrase